jgi:hypothetical protein
LRQQGEKVATAKLERQLDRNEQARQDALDDIREQEALDKEDYPSGPALIAEIERRQHAAAADLQKHLRAWVSQPISQHPIPITLPYWIEE